MKCIIFLMVLVTSSVFAKSPDFSKQWAISLSGGFTKPILRNKFDRRADGDMMYGIYLRYQINRESSLQIGYTRMDWDHSPTAPRIYDLIYIHRLTPREWFTPIWGAGVGLVDIAHYNVDENLKFGAKARGGIEYVLSDDITVDAVLDYQFVNKQLGESRNLTIGEFHVLAPQLILNYFF